MIPGLDKSSIPAFGALVGCLFFAPRRIGSFWRGFGIAELLIALLLIVPFITATNNQDAIVLASRTIPGENLYDAISAAAAQLIFILPFFLGRQFFRGAGDFTLLIRTLVISALIYSLPMLFEIRMSPQLHTWVYGYFPSDFGQQYRDEGFRPVVFLSHGLFVAFFIATAVIAATALWRARVRIRILSPAFTIAYLALILALCKTLGAALYGYLLIPVVRWMSAKAQLRIALCFACFALGYPVLRTADLIPTNTLLEAANYVSVDREASLRVRFDNERVLLERASARIWFGWGRWGRNRSFDAESGQDVSITDGAWIITLGVFGIFGFAAQFGLLAFPVFKAAVTIRYMRSLPDALNIAAVSLIVAVGMIDLIPNGSLDSLRWLFAGALLGRVEELRQKVRTSAKHRTGHASNEERSLVAR